MTTPADPAADLERRIRQFYAELNARRFDQCYRLIDPRLLDRPGTVTRFQYEAALAEFLGHVGAVRVRRVAVAAVHQNEPSQLYEGRDFALARTHWEDSAGEPHEFAERWVLDGGDWFTRSTGLLMPAGAPTPPVGAPAGATGAGH